MIFSRSRSAIQIFLNVSVIAALMLLFGNASVYAVPTDGGLTLGDSRPSQTTTYSFSVSTLDTASDVACVELDLGANSDGSGAITGLDTSSSTLDANSVVTGTTVSNAGSANHTLRASKATPSNPNASGTITWGAVDNGSTVDTGYYGVFTTYSDQSCSSSNESITIQFIYTDGQTVSVTVDPDFSFSVSGVASSQTINSATTTVTTTSTTVPFGTVTTSSNGIAAQDLGISTNAQGGYNVYARQTQALTNSNSDTIDAVSTDTACTYGSPANFSTAGTEAFGFTTDDSDISSGNFTTNNWCDITATNQVVATNSTPPSGTETTRVGYQVGVANDTEPGVYSNVLIYTAVPTY